MRSMKCVLTDGAEDGDAVAQAVERHGHGVVPAHPALALAEPRVEATEESTQAQMQWSAEKRDESGKATRWTD